METTTPKAGTFTGKNGRTYIVVQGQTDMAIEAASGKVFKLEDVLPTSEAIKSSEFRVDSVSYDDDSLDEYLISANYYKMPSFKDSSVIIERYIGIGIDADDNPFLIVGNPEDDNNPDQLTVGYSSRLASYLYYADLIEADDDVSDLMKNLGFQYAGHGVAVNLEKGILLNHQQEFAYLKRIEEPKEVKPKTKQRKIIE